MYLHVAMHRKTAWLLFLYTKQQTRCRHQPKMFLSLLFRFRSFAFNFVPRSFLIIAYEFSFLLLLARLILFPPQFYLQTCFFTFQIRNKNIMLSSTIRNTLYYFFSFAFKTFIIALLLFSFFVHHRRKKSSAGVLKRKKHLNCRFLGFWRTQHMKPIWLCLQLFMRFWLIFNESWKFELLNLVDSVHRTGSKYLQFIT